MIGLIFLLVLAVYVGVAWFIVKALPSKKSKYIGMAVFVLIPTWDVVPGWVYLQHLCQAEGGVKIYKPVEGIEGFYTTEQSIIRDALMKYGYKFIESTSIVAKHYRDSLGKNGELVIEEIDKPTSEYMLGILENGRAWGIKESKYVISKGKNGEVLATSTQFYFPGNWIQKIASPLLGGGEACPAFPQKSYMDFIFETLKPAKSPN